MNRSFPKPSAAQIRQLRRDNLKWPATLAPIPRELWPDPKDGPQSGSVCIAAMRSRTFMVVTWLEPNGAVRLSVNRTDWDERKQSWREDIGWEDLQRLKAEAGYADRAAVELFPPDDQVVNVANMRHLFILEQPPGFMWKRKQA